MDLEDFPVDGEITGERRKNKEKDIYKYLIFYIDWLISHSFLEFGS